MMKLSIIIVNWNTQGFLRQCLLSIISRPVSFSNEILVVDNASTDGSLAMLKQEFPQVRVIQNTTNLGFAHANNQGLRQARGEYFLLLNSDTIVNPDALDRLIQTADDHPEAGVFGTRLINPDGSIQESWAQFPTLLSELTGRNVRTNQPVPSTPGLYRVDWVGGACLLARKAAVNEIGLLDESFFMYSEEVDWCYRMKIAGWLVYYLANAEMIHFGGGSANRSSPDQLIRLYESKIRFFAKHHTRRQAAGLRTGLLWVNRLSLAKRELMALLRPTSKNDLHQRIANQWQLIHWLESPRVTALLEEAVS